MLGFLTLIVQSQHGIDNPLQGSILVEGNLISRNGKKQNAIARSGQKYKAIALVTYELIW